MHKNQALIYKIIANKESIAEGYLNSSRNFFRKETVYLLNAYASIKPIY